MAVKFDLSFPHRYDVELPTYSVPDKTQRYYFPDNKDPNIFEGFLVQVTPYDGPTWIGDFDRAYPTITGIFSCPDENTLSVVSGGMGFIIQVDNPKVWEEIPVFPIINVHLLTEVQKLVLFGFRDIVVYGAEGFLWRIENPAWDGIEIGDVTRDELNITVWNHYQQREMNVVIDIATGKYDDLSLVEWFSRPEMSISYRSPIRRIIKLGERIQLEKSIKQPQQLFDWETYNKFLNQRGSLEQEYKRLASTMDRATSRAYLQRLREMRDEYISRLPLHLLAVCPYCQGRIIQPVDSFSLAGFYPLLNIPDHYLSGTEWFSSQRPRRQCRHALFATISLNFNKLTPNDLPTWMLQRKWNWIAASPLLIAWPLVAQRTSAVIQPLPIGRLDDSEPLHRYTAYFITYFASDLSNLKTKELWVSGDMGRPATEGVYYDPDLIKWVKAKRLFWLDPDNPARLVSGLEDKFPYIDIQPQGRYRLIENGDTEGPNPYKPRFIWQGNAPHHDESFSKTIE